MKRLLLFDIDGTLIRCGKAPRQAITRAVEEVFGTRGNIDTYSFSGKTDPQIIHEVMTQASFSADEVQNRMARTLDRYTELLDQTLKPDDISVLNGIRELLACFDSHPDAYLGLLTGNLYTGARIKLSRAGLDRYFLNGHAPVGAFGSDSMYREQLPAIAVRRALAIHGIVFKDKAVVIIGDSPFDILCGRHMNVRTVAVATGWHARDELMRYHPDICFDDLADTEQVVAQLMA